MKVITSGTTWRADYFDPDRVHLLETCDGRPRVGRYGDRDLHMALCGAWLTAQATDPSAPHGDSCSTCRALHALVGGIV